MESISLEKRYFFLKLNLSFSLSCLLTKYIQSLCNVYMAKIIISLPDGLLKAVDEFCEESQYNRSEFIRFLMRQELGSFDPEEDEKAVTIDE